MIDLNRISRSFVLAAIGACGAGAAVAGTTWDLDACTGGTKGATFTGCGYDPVNSTTATSVKVDIKAYSSNAGANFNTGTGIATINNGGSYIGVYSGAESGNTSPNHAIDNYTTVGFGTELVYLKFTAGVDLTQVVANWTNDSIVAGENANFQVWRWNSGTTAPTITSYNPTSMTGWTMVKAGDFETGTTQAINDTAYYSSHWLISTEFGGSKDAFKLGTVSAALVCDGTGYTVDATGKCNPPSGGGGSPAPEPASLALFGVAALGAGIARRRARAKAV